MPFAQHPIYVLKADFFRALGHPARVRILELVSEEERAVGELQAELGLDSSGTSQHLAALRRQGLVETRRQGTTIFYCSTGFVNLHASRRRSARTARGLMWNCVPVGMAQTKQVVRVGRRA
jgi:DNA-binding transcriptional ArsR family regulator